MADPTPSASASDSEAPAAHADVEIKSLDANGALSEGDLGTPRGAKRKSPMRSEEDEADMGEAKDELFGDDDSEDVPGTPEDDEDAPSPGKKRRLLDDEELDSGDDEGRRDRVTDDEDEDGSQERRKEEPFAEVELGRHLTPKGSDGETYILKFPPFLGVEKQAFTLKSFSAPTADHHRKQPSTTFSALQTANTTLRWRRDPSDPSKLQSNSRIIRWSDGSLTLQVGSSPLDQHELPAVPFAPPQRDPKRPTPVSKRQTPAPPYNAKADLHTYLVAQHTLCSLAQITNHVTASLSVQTTEEEEDAAVLALQAAMAQHTGGGANAATGAAAGGKDTAGTAVIALHEDPELAKRRAEQAEKEKAKAERRRMAQAEREREKTHRALGRAGVRGAAGLSGGLTAGGLEDDELGMGVGGARGRGAKKAPGARKQRRRRDSYTDEDEEEDYGRRGRTREDEYDEDDGFLVGSDEEPEVVEDEDEEEEEMMSEGGDDGEGKGKASPAPKEDKGGGGGAGQGGGRLKRRKVLDDEDEDE